MSDRISADGLPTPSVHMGSGEAYLHRMCLLLDQISRQFDELLIQGQAPVLAFTSSSDAQVELVTEPADPQPPARPRKKTTPPAKKGG